MKEIENPFLKEVKKAENKVAKTVDTVIKYAVDKAFSTQENKLEKPNNNKWHWFKEFFDLEYEIINNNSIKIIGISQPDDVKTYIIPSELVFFNKEKKYFTIKKDDSSMNKAFAKNFACHSVLVKMSEGTIKMYLVQFTDAYTNLDARNFLKRLLDENKIYLLKDVLQFKDTQLIIYKPDKKQEVTK